MHGSKRKLNAWPTARSGPDELNENEFRREDLDHHRLKRSRTASENSLPTPSKEENNGLPSMRAANTVAASAVQPLQRPSTKKRYAWPCLRTSATAKLI